MRKSFLTTTLFLLIASSVIQLACNKDNQKDNEEIIDPKTKPHLNANLKYGVVTDIDGNKYATIEIGASGSGRTTGSQIWMAENLSVSKYNDGSPIPNVADGNAIDTGAWGYYNNDPKYNTTYGKLYNWKAVKTGKLCPKGWHVPEVSEWRQLKELLGGSSSNNIGGKLKAKGNTSDGTGLWLSPNSGATNESGFSGLPGGMGELEEHFIKGNSMEMRGRWWSSTEGVMRMGNDTIYYPDALYNLKSDAYGVDEYITPAGYFGNENFSSCRCIKD